MADEDAAANVELSTVESSETDMHMAGGAISGGRATVRFGALLAIAVCASVLMGWALDIPQLTRVLPQLSSMKAWTAVCLACAGTTLWLINTTTPTRVLNAISLGTIGVVTIVATLTLVEYATASDLGLDRMLWHDAAASTTAPLPGRMGLNTAIALLLLSLALANKRSRRVRAAMVAEWVAGTVFLIALLPMLGYIYSASSLTAMSSSTQMALHTSILFLVLSVATVAVAPHGPLFRLVASNGPGGTMLRRLVPLFSGFLIVIGWLRLAGQERGYYGLQVGLAIMITVTLVAFAMASGFTAKTLNATARARDTLDRELADRELRYRLLVEATFDGVVVSQNGHVREANAGYARMFGYSVDELTGMSVFDLVAPESQALVSSRIAAGISGAYSVTGRRKDGSLFTFDTVVRTHGVGPDQIRVAALRDTTVQRSLEERLRQSEKMEAIGQLAGGVAHDFNNLLTVILSYTSLLQQEEQPTTAQRELREIHDAALSAAGLTRQLLAFSRQQVLAPQVISVNAIVTATEKLLRRLIGEDIEVRTALAQGLPNILADPVQIEQVLLNLAVNARDAMPDGGLLVLETASVKLDEAYVEMHPEVTPGEYIQLSVIDSGIGMDEATRVRIFEPFFTTKSVGHGTGLGLASVYGVVQQSGGHIWVYSEVGHGTTFRVYFPALTKAAQLTPVSTAAVRSLAGTETVLLAEDNAAVRKLAHRVLTMHGYTVLDAPDGVAALELARAHGGVIHLLLSDVVMPGISGRLLAEQLRGERPTLRVLFISGYTRDTAIQRGILATGMTLLQKPFTPVALARAVRDVLDGPIVAP